MKTDLVVTALVEILSPGVKHLAKHLGEALGTSIPCVQLVFPSVQIEQEQLDKLADNAQLICQLRNGPAAVSLKSIAVRS